MDNQTQDIIAPYGENITKYFQPAEANDGNLVDITANLLEEYIDTNAKTYFLSDPEIIGIRSLTSQVQRFMINKYFSRLLLKYRAAYNIRVDGVITMLADDGYAEDWITINKHFLFPFLRDHKIFEILYNN